jgi:hypothetical protein
MGFFVRGNGHTRDEITEYHSPNPAVFYRISTIYSVCISSHTSRTFYRVMVALDVIPNSVLWYYPSSVVSSSSSSLNLKYRYSYSVSGSIIIRIDLISFFSITSIGVALTISFSFAKFILFIIPNLVFQNCQIGFWG